MQTAPENSVSPATPVTSAASTPFALGPALGLLSLRLWLGVRAIATGVEKYAGSVASDQPVAIDGAPNTYGLTAAASHKVYSLSNYAGIPEALRSKFEAEPLLHPAALKAFNTALGPALLLLGVTVLLGILPRLSLFAMGVLYTMLTVGLILIKQDPGVAYLGTHLGLIALALIFADRDRLVLLGRKL